MEIGNRAIFTTEITEERKEEKRKSEEMQSDEVEAGICVGGPPGTKAKAKATAGKKPPASEGGRYTTKPLHKKAGLRRIQQPDPRGRCKSPM
jgi:hypothetical protein